MPVPSSFWLLRAVFCMICTVLASVFLLASYLFNKSPIAKQKSRCYNKDKKKTFSISFSFSYHSLFVDTPGSTGHRSRGSPLWGCPHRQFVHSWSVFVTPLGTARYRFIVRYLFFYGNTSTGNSYAKDIFDSQKEVFYGTTNHSLFIC